MFLYSKKTLVALLMLCFQALAYGQLIQVRDIVLCPGESIVLGGTTYTTADTVSLFLAGPPDTLVTYQLSFSPGVSNAEACNCHPASFFKILGTETQLEFGTAITRSFDGNIYVAGRKNNRTFLQKLSAFGENIWVQDFAASPFESITPTQIIEDADGMIVGCGTQGLFAGLRRGFIFKYNPNTGAFIWARTVSSNNPVAVGILEKSPGGNYLYYENPIYSSGQTDAEILEINRNTGVIEPGFFRRYTVSNTSEIFNKSILSNGRLYTLGTTELSADNFSTYNRPFLADINPDNGFASWNQLSHIDTAVLANLIGRDLILDGNALMSVYDGTENAIENPFASDVFLQKTDLDGTIIWIKKYQINGVVYQVIAVSDGYVLYGQTASNERYFIKTDKNGVPVWAKKMTFGPTGGVFASSIGPSQGIEINGSTVFTGIATSGNTDAFLVRLSAQGEVSDSCGFFQEMEVPFVDVVNPVRNAVPIIPGLSTATTLQINTAWQPTELFATLQCPDCVEPDPCPERNDLVVELTSSSCSSGRVTLGIRVCDLDGTPSDDVVSIIFYDSNPFTNAAQALGETVIFTNELDSCSTLVIQDLEDIIGAAASNGTQIFALVNSDVNLVTPIPLSSFPVTGIAECNYDNNLDSLVITYPNIPDLNLGADRLLCAGDTVVLNAGGGFFNYKWSTGSNSQKITLFQGGQFFLTVTDVCGGTQFDTIQVQFKNLPSKTYFAEICPGTSVTFEGQVFTQSGFFYDTIPALTGAECDTAITIEIIKLPYQAREENISFCPGDTIYINGIAYDESGLARDTVPALVGCDTVITYLLKQLPKPFRYDSLYICPGETVTINGVVYSGPQVVVDTLPSNFAGACDTAVTITIIELPQVVLNESISFCPGDEVVLGGQSYTQPGTVTIYRPFNGFGCDTVVVYTLEWLPGPTLSKLIQFCPGASVTVAGNTYTQPGTVFETIPGLGTECDTLVTFTLQWSPSPTQSESIVFCQGTAVTLQGVTYTQPGTVVLTHPGLNGTCDTIVTYTLSYLTPDPSQQLAIQCPANINIAVTPGSGPQAVNYTIPTASSDCECPGLNVELTQGPAPGGLFGVGVTNVCYTATDACNSSKSCCFNVTVREELPCDTKAIGCMKYDILSITSDADGQYTYKMRVTNNCSNMLIYTAIQLPAGLTAVSPANNSVFVSSEGRSYLVRNPNPTPFYSIRFKSVSDSIANGASDVFEFTLPEQIHPNYFLITSRLEPQIFYEALLNTFNCPVGASVSQQRSDGTERDLFENKETGLFLYPNPNTGVFYVDLSDWQNQNVQVQVLNLQGQLIKNTKTLGGSAAEEISLPAALSNGMYLLKVQSSDGRFETVRFMIER